MSHNSIAIGCLVQWYEIEMLEEFLDSLAIATLNSKSDIHININLCTNTDLEKPINDNIINEYIVPKFYRLIESLEGTTIYPSDHGPSVYINAKDTNTLYTIADFRRDFNADYSEIVDYLFWGETDSLIPLDAFKIIPQALVDHKCAGFFGTCKMWDDSWRPVEFNQFTDLPRDPYAVHGTRRYMDYETACKLNETDKPDIQRVPMVFNGCGLFFTSSIIKDVNIPESVFFISEDTAFKNALALTYGNKLPFYCVKNKLLVHNREHPAKRFYIKEEGDSIKDKRDSHNWYKIAGDMSTFNAMNFYKNDTKLYTWDDVWNQLQQQ